MSQSSRIEWTEATWNPVTGCTKVSSGCAHCYAERIAYRFAGLHGFPDRPNHFNITLHPDRLEQPLHWRKPRLVFVNSMSDLFHRDVPEGYIHQVFEVMEQATEHTFQILTKRHRRLVELESRIEWPDNVWVGVTVENANLRLRIDSLRRVAARIKFVSFEPLLERVTPVDLAGIDWVIVGGESGPGARPMSAEWVTDIRDLCLAASTPFFFKQWGGVNKKKRGRRLEGRLWEEMPTVR